MEGASWEGDCRPLVTGVMMLCLDGGEEECCLGLKENFGHLFLNIKDYLSLKGGKKPVFCFVCGEQTDAV